MSDRELILALAGILGTLGSSAVGFYFTRRAETASYRTHLYEQQVRLVLDLFEGISEAHARAGVVIEATGAEMRGQAAEKLRLHMQDLGLLASRGTALLPTPLYRATNQFYGATVDLLRRQADVGTEADNLALMEAVERRAATFAETAREFLGVDPLSQESLGLFARSSLPKYVISSAP